MGADAASKGAGNEEDWEAAYTPSRSATPVGGTERPRSARVGRPGSVAARTPCKLLLQERVVRQLRRPGSSWGVAEVADWVEASGLGQYRRSFVHNGVGGALLLRLTSQQLKEELGVSSLGHREALLHAVAELQQSQSRGGATARRNAGSPESNASGGSRPCSPPQGVPDLSHLRAYEQRNKLLHQLHKAESRTEQRRRTAEHVLHTVELAADEVKRLQAAIVELDRASGLAAAGEQPDALDVHGALAWLPAGTQRRGATPCSPAGRATSAAPHDRGGSPTMSRVSRRLMEGSSGGGFLQRVAWDLEQRQAKAAAARPAFSGGDALERERQQRDLELIKDVVSGRSGDVHAALSASDPQALSQALGEAAQACQQDCDLSDEQVAAVQALRTPARKAARLAALIRAARFTDRLQADLASRDARLGELQQRWLRHELAGTPGGRAQRSEVEEAADARSHFLRLGWPEEELRLTPADATAAVDVRLGALLRQAEELAARQEKEGGRKHSATAEAPLPAEAPQPVAEQVPQSAETQQEGMEACLEGGQQQPEGPSSSELRAETVRLLARCPPGELALLQSLAGYRQLLNVWRARRGQQFLADLALKEAERRRRQQELEAQMYPKQEKVLPRAQFQQFMDRILEDTQRRARNKEDIAAKAKADALAKLIKNSPGHKAGRPASARP